MKYIDELNAFTILKIKKVFRLKLKPPSKINVVSQKPTFMNSSVESLT
jgi:hypothetical protein